MSSARRVFDRLLGDYTEAELRAIARELRSLTRRVDLLLERKGQQAMTKHKHDRGAKHRRDDLGDVANRNHRGVRLTHAHLCPVCHKGFNCKGNVCAPFNGVPHKQCAPSNKLAQQTREVSPSLGNA